MNLELNKLLSQERGLFFEFQMNSHAENKSVFEDTQLFEVVEFNIEEGLSSPYIISLLLVSREDNLTAEQFIDQAGVLSIFRNYNLERYFHGIVFSFTKGNSGSRHTFYKLELVPELSRLSLRYNSRIFQAMTVEEIAQKIFKEMHIEEYQFHLKHRLEAREFCVQYAESDLHFLERIFAEEGIFYYFQHSDTLHTLMLVDNNIFSLPLPAQLFNNNEGGVSDLSYIQSLERTANVAPSTASLNDYTFKNPKYPLHIKRRNEKITPQNELYEHYMYPGRYKDQSVGEFFTETRLNYLRNESNTIQCSSNSAPIVAGYHFSILDHFDLDEKQKWLVTRVLHRGKQHQSLEEAGGDTGYTQYSNEFYALPHTQQWKAKPEPKPRIYGPQVAIVVGPKNEELYTDEYGRVKIQFPWDRYGELNDSSSCWIRVAQGWAGSRYGGVVLPRVGHEVIVSFLEGDPDQPIITGRTYHATNRQPYALPALKTIASLKSKEHKSSGYNELLLDDTTGELKTQLHTTHGATQLTMGHLTHPRKNDGSAEHRGCGFELRTDNWGAVRAGKGLYISTEKREKSVGKQLDIDESIAQLEAALHLAKELKKASEVAQIPSNNTSIQEAQLNSVYRDLKSAGMLLHSPEGIALTSPKTIQTASSENISMTATNSVELNAFNGVNLKAKEKISLLAVEDEMSIATNQGKLKVQSQNNSMQLLSQDELSIISTKDRIILAADKEIVLTSGQAYIKIRNGGVEIGGPSLLRVQTAYFTLEGPNKMHYDFAKFATYNPTIKDEMFVLKDEKGDPIVNFKYKIEREDGEIFKGVTNSKGETIRVSTGEKSMKLTLFADDE